MENATQALFIAAGVLIGVMIISIGVYFFTNVSSVGNSLEQNISETQIQKFNTQFTIYDKTPKTKLKGTKKEYFYDFNSISDVISAINKAYDINAKNNYDIQTGIQVSIRNLNEIEGINNISSNDVYGITPRYQKYCYQNSKSDKNSIYKLENFEGKKITDEKNPESTILNLNILLEKLSTSKKIEGEGGEILRAYPYIFDGETYINDETGLIDRIEFTCKKNGYYDDYPT